MIPKFSYFMVNKPYGMLSQFSREGKWQALCDLNYNFDKDVYPIGRLDADSEGLLLLTNDKRLNALLLQPKQHVVKTYLLQVEGTANAQHINQLLTQVSFTVNNKQHITNAAMATIVDAPSYIMDRNEAPILPKRFPVTSWITLTITEGKNRQVRKMTAAVGLPTLRLIRIGLGNFNYVQFASNPVSTISLQDIKRNFNLIHL
jgi:23S rRNA pseudouridine2457 synthase